jgi:hypothetical protein
MKRKIVYLMRGLPSSGKSYTASQLVTKTGVICETDQYFYTQVGNDPNIFDYQKDLMKTAREWNFRRFKNAIAEEISPIVVDRGNGLNKETKRYAQYAVEYGYKVELKEPDSLWWREIRVLLKHKEHTWPILEVWAKELANMNSSTHRVPVSVFLSQMKSWKSDLTIKDILNWEEPKVELATTEI